MKHVYYVVFIAFHVVFHPLLEAEEVNGDVVVGGQYLLKVPEYADDCCCCSNCSSVLFFVLLSLFFRVGFPLFILAEWLLLCCQICDIHNLI